MTTTSTIAGAEALKLSDLITPTPQGIASRILSKNNGGSLTLFAFDAGQGLAEHTAPFDAIVMVLDGTFTLTIGGQPVTATAGTVVRMPAQHPSRRRRGRTGADAPDDAAGAEGDVNWSTPETVAGFARGAPNQALMDFAAREYARGGRRVLDLGCGAAPCRAAGA